MRIFQLQTINGAGLPVDGQTAGHAILFDNGTYAISSEYSASSPLPDRGRYTIASDGTLTMSPDGGGTYTGFVNAAVSIVNAGGLSFVSTPIAVSA